MWIACDDINIFLSLLDISSLVSLGTGFLQLKHTGTHKYSVIDWHSPFFLLCHFQFVSSQFIIQILVTSSHLCDLPFFTVIHFSLFLVFQHWRSPSPSCSLFQFFSSLVLSYGKGRGVEPGGKAELQWCPHVSAQKPVAEAWLCCSEGTKVTTTAPIDPSHHNVLLGSWRSS